MFRYAGTAAIASVILCVGVNAGMRPITDGHAEEWLCAGTWAGPAGLTLLGIDADNEVRPCAGDVVPVKRFDETCWTNWTGIVRTDAGYVIAEKGGDFTWAKGCSYAALYVKSDEAKTVDLEVTQSGYETRAFVNGVLVRETNRLWRKRKEKTVGIADQGNELTVDTEVERLTSTLPIPLKAGVNFVMLKLYTRQQAGERVFFDAEFKDAAGLASDVNDPETDPVKHNALGQMYASVNVSAVANLPHPGEKLSVTTAIHYPWRKHKRPKSTKKDTRQEIVTPACPETFDAVVEQVVRDFDGRETARITYPITVPGTNMAALCTAGETGYYSVHTTIKDTEGRRLFVFPADGFSVIGGTVSMRKRYRAGKMKTASCFYWVNGANSDGIFTWMDRMGILHNVGGSASDTNIWSKAAAKGITMTADFLDPWGSENFIGKLAAVSNAAPYTRIFKAWNEIDISRPQFKKTPELWTARTKMEYEAVKAIRPDAVYTGGSFVRVGNSDWFKGCLTNGMERYVDVWDVHAYPKYPPKLDDRHVANSGNESGYGVETAYRSALGRENDKLFYLGECGARCSHGDDARRWQADTVAKLTAWAGSATNYLQIAHLVPWVKTSDGGDIPIAHFPAEAALYTAVALTDGLPYERITTESKHIQAARFGSAVMAWTTHPGGEWFTFTPPEGELVTVDVVGRVRPTTRTTDGCVSLHLSPSPVYLLSRTDYDRLTR